MIEVRPAAPVETVTPIKPSEAIRLGCLLRPLQAFGTIADTRGGVCALGAMMFGFGADGMGFHVARVTVSDLPCPACGRIRGAADLFTPAHLNDDHRWSRERIADWLEAQGL